MILTVILIRKTSDKIKSSGKISPTFKIHVNKSSQSNDGDNEESLVTKTRVHVNSEDSIKLQRKRID